MRVVCVAPHPDDESIGCGGTLAKWAERGWDVGVLWVSGRDTEVEASEGDAALAALGISEAGTLGLPTFGLSYDLTAVETFVRAFRELRPEVLLYPHAGEDDRHHRAVHDLADEASWLAAHDEWPALGPPMPRRPGLVLEYEVWTPIARPTHVEDITAWMPRKLQAVRSYRSQLVHTALDLASEGLARYRGAMTGRGEFAEAFLLHVHDGELTQRIEGGR